MDTIDRGTSTSVVNYFVCNVKQLVKGIHSEDIGIHWFASNAFELPVIIIFQVDAYSNDMDALLPGQFCLWNCELWVDVGKTISDDNHW